MKNERQMQNPIAYAVKHINDEVRMNSQSGGLFTAVSDWVLNQNGIVYGCILDPSFQAIHVRAENREQRDAMRGSKYIQSTMGEVFSMVKADLISGKHVLFTGTSCQVSGLKAYLGKEYPLLLCMDIICHGVPSPMIWKEYLAWQAKHNKSEIVSVVFRNKLDFGWRNHTETLEFANGEKIHAQVFKGIFHGDAALRPSCYKCPYKSLTHPSDITFADCWGIENAAPEFQDAKGVSLALINGDKGMSYFSKIRSDLECREVDIQKCMQPQLISPAKRTFKRDVFWKVHRKFGFEWIARLYGNYGVIGWFKRWLIKLIRGWRK